MHIDSSSPFSCLNSIPTGWKVNGLLSALRNMQGRRACSFQHFIPSRWALPDQLPGQALAHYTKGDRGARCNCNQHQAPSVPHTTKLNLGKKSPSKQARKQGWGLPWPNRKLLLINWISRQRERCPGVHSAPSRTETEKQVWGKKNPKLKSTLPATLD